MKFGAYVTQLNSGDREWRGPRKLFSGKAKKLQKLKKIEVRGIPNEQSEKPEPLVTWRAKGLLFPRKFKKIAKLKKLHDIFASAMR